MVFWWFPPPHPDLWLLKVSTTHCDRCMHDEASPFYVEMVDQTTRGHQFLRKNFGENAIPRGTWQIDPFGHSNT